MVKKDDEVVQKQRESRKSYWLLGEMLEKNITKRSERQVIKDAVAEGLNKLQVNSNDFKLNLMHIRSVIDAVKNPEMKKNLWDRYNSKELIKDGAEITRKYYESLASGVQKVNHIDPNFDSFFNGLNYGSVDILLVDKEFNSAPFIEGDVNLFLPHEGIPSKPKKANAYTLRLLVEDLTTSSDRASYTQEQLRVAREQRVLVISGHKVPASEMKNVRQNDGSIVSKKVKEVLQERYNSVLKSVVAEKNHYFEVLRNKNEAKRIERENKKNQYAQNTNKNVGPLISGENLESYIGPFMSRENMKIVTEKLENNVYSENAVIQAQKLFKYLYDEGLEYDMNLGGNNDEFKGQLEVVLKDTNNTKLRMLDSTKEHYIGRVHNSFGTFIAKFGLDNWNNPNPEAILAFALGKRKGVITPPKADSSTKNSEIKLEGMPIKYSFSPEGKRLESINLTNEFEAKDVLNEMIDRARERYLDELLGISSEFYDSDLYIQQLNLEQLVAEGIKDEPNVEEDKLREKIAKEIVNNVVGTYADGFNPSIVLGYKKEISKFDSTELLINSLQLLEYDSKKLKGTEFGVNQVKDRMVRFDETTSQDISEMKDKFLLSKMKHVQNELISLGIVGAAEKDGVIVESPQTKPIVKIDANGIIRWHGVRETAKPNEPDRESEIISGDIGQIFAPDENGLIPTKFNSSNNYNFVPAYRGHFAFTDNINKPRMERLRLVGFEKSLEQKLSETVRSQALRPVSFKNKEINLATDTTRLNKLYHGEVYGERLPIEWYESNQLKPDVKDAIIKTMKNTIRFPSSYIEASTTHAHRRYKDNQVRNQIALKQGKELPKQTLSQVMFTLTGNQNMRVLADDYTNVIDLNMTATNKNQGISVRKVDGAIVKKDGSVIPAPSKYDENGVLIPDRTALMKLPYFNYGENNAWDRRQMSANQLLTALRVDENSRITLMNFGGWTMEDGYVVSKEYAERNSVKATDGTMRPLQAGDKISDFGGNKGTISLVVDASLSKEEAIAQNLEREVAFFKKNKSLDLIGSPYSMLSRHNAGVPKEMMESKIKVVKDPETGKRIGESGVISTIITDLTVDKKTTVYEENDGRKFSAQLAWAATALGAEGILKEVYGKNDQAWHDYAEYLAVTGVALSKEGSLDIGIESTMSGNLHKKTHKVTEESVEDNIKQLTEEVGFIQLPKLVRLESGIEIDKLPVLRPRLRNQSKLQNGELKVHNYTKHYADIIKNIQYYYQSEKVLSDDTFSVENKASVERLFKKSIETGIGQLQAEIIKDQLGDMDGSNSKYGHVREQIMGKKLKGSANATATADPRLDLDEIRVSPEIFKNLKVKEGEYVAIWRDPVLRSGALRGFRVYPDERITGIAMNPAVAKSFDADFDGDAFGVAAFHTVQAQYELKHKLSIENNLINPGSPNEETYLNVAMDMVTGSVEAGITVLEDEKDLDNKNKPKRQLVEKLSAIAKELSPKEALAKSNEIIHQSLYVNNFGTAAVRLTSKKAMMQSFEKMIAEGSKGSKGSLEILNGYYEKIKTRKDDQDIQLASGTKSDDTGVPGSTSQQLVKLLRNVNIAHALEFTYPMSQSVLQIKHDAIKAILIDETVNKDLKNLLQGKDRKSTSKKDANINKYQFIKQLTDVYKEVGVEVKEEIIASIADTLSDENGIIVGLKGKTEEIASPLDKVAYEGGFKTTLKLAKEKANLLDGEWSKLFAPQEIRTNLMKQLMEKQKQSEYKSNIEQYQKAIEKENIIEQPLEQPKQAENKAEPKAKNSVESELEQILEDQLELEF